MSAHLLAPASHGRKPRAPPCSCPDALAQLDCGMKAVPVEKLPDRADTPLPRTALPPAWCDRRSDDATVAASTSVVFRCHKQGKTAAEAPAARRYGSVGDQSVHKVARQRHPPQDPGPPPQQTEALAATLPVPVQRDLPRSPRYAKCRDDRSLPAKPGDNCPAGFGFRS